MATVLAPMITGIAPDARERGEHPLPAQRFACTHIVNTAWVVESLTAKFIHQYGKEVAAPFIARIETVRGNSAPAGETFHHVSKGYGA